MTTDQPPLPVDRPLGSILVVDDDEGVAHTLTTALIRAGHEVTTVHRGREALRCVKQQRFDIVILDLAMPDVTGMDVLRALAPPDQVGDVIVLTGCGDKTLAAQARQLGACHFLAKPAKLHNLWAVVADTLLKQQARRDKRTPVSIIDADFASIHAVEEIATILGITMRAVEIAVESEKGAAPLAYLHQQRIEAAKVLLMQTEMQVKDIFGEVGYRTSQHFSRWFKRIVGVTPTAYRRRLRGR